MERFERKPIALILLIPVVIVGLGLFITNGLSTQQDTSIKNEPTDMGDINSSMAMSSLYYYSDEAQDLAPYLYYNTPSNYQKLQVRYTFPGTRIVTGVRFRHLDSDIGPFDVGITFEGDTGSAPYTWTNIPASSSGTWRRYSLRASGVTYVIDDDPVITFNSTDLLSNSIEFCKDTDVSGSHSYHDSGTGTWVLDANGELVVEALYESIPTLTASASQSGDIIGYDYVDAYYVSL
jgi:hypothetical protein